MLGCVVARVPLRACDESRRRAREGEDEPLMIPHPRHWASLYRSWRYEYWMRVGARELRRRYFPRGVSKVGQYRGDAPPEGRSHPS